MSAPGVDSLSQQYRRAINCLSDTDRTTRRRALTELSALRTASTAAESAADGLGQLWSASLCAALLRLFSDGVEKHREMSVALVTDILSQLPMRVRSD
tara:strand:- start:94 stop:387 length:294 start_codon:yes stop_codon:yes gene_type:complete